MASQLRLGDLLRAGARAVSKYTGTVLAVFVAQSLVAVACMFAIAFVLAQQFAQLHEIFDEAVDGDLVSLIWCVRAAIPSLLAIAGIVFGALAVWQIATWFLFGGLAGVLAQAPEGRGDTARCFGASGAATFLTYARLALCALPGYVLVMIAFAVGMRVIEHRIEYALTLPQLVVPIVLAALPAMLLLLFFTTVTDYARVELSLRHESHAPSVVKTYVRTVVFVAKRPITLLHVTVGWMFWWLITLAYVLLAQDHPMYGAGGAVTLFFVRQVVSLLRMAVHVGVLGGQIEVGRTRPLPPRRVEVKVEPKA